MNELQKITGAMRVVEISGGNRNTRFAITSDDKFPTPDDDPAAWISEYDQCTRAEAERLANHGRQVVVHMDGAVLLVDDAPVMVIGGDDGCRDIDAIIERLDGVKLIGAESNADS